MHISLFTLINSNLKTNRMKETLELRNKPELKIILDTDEFEIVDSYEQNNSGIYSFRDLKKVVLNSERTNWLFSIFTIIISFFFGGAIEGGKFKNKSNLEIQILNRNLKIWLIDADFEIAKKVTEILSRKTYAKNNF